LLRPLALPLPPLRLRRPLALLRLLALLPLALLVPVPVLVVLVMLPHRRGVVWQSTFG
jgi:hypothetical protein